MEPEAAGRAEGEEEEGSLGEGRGRAAKGASRSTV